jgi:Mg2+-importing ATPase
MIMEKVIKTDKLLGLTSIEADRRLREFGENAINGKKKIGPFVVFLKKFNSPLLIILIVVSIISFFLGQKTNAIIIIFMVFLSAVLDFANSYRSEKAVEKLVQKVLTTVTAIRDGVKVEIPFKNIVPGDIISLTAGDVTPADSIVLEAKDFFINQSALTGESFPVEKFVTESFDYDKVDFTPENKNIIFMGTNTVTGYGTVEVLRTGHNTEYGKIIKQLSDRSDDTEFEKGIRQFSYFVMKVNFVLVGLVLIINTLMGRGIFNSFLFAIAIAIGLTPELLPVILSVSLSRGSIKMAKKHVIVKNLSAIQDFGSMNILCTDKTGTLTQNKITLVKHVDFHGNESDAVYLYSYINSSLHTGVVNPMDNAIAEYKKLDISKFKKIDEVPFDFTRRRDSIVVDDAGKKILITKGAPESIFQVCKSCHDEKGSFPFKEDTVKSLSDQYEALSSDGFRVLALAIKELDRDDIIYNVDDEKDMIFMGFMAFLDPPKEGVIHAIRQLEDSGIEIKILTGDSEVLTQKICRDIKLPVKGTLIGSQIAGMSDGQLRAVVKQTTIFGRITPEQKERIISSLRKSGNAVGYLGDGINDAPALKAADVGISVNNAVEVAKDTADIILMDKKLEVLHDGVIEGRKTFQNTLKYVTMGLSSNFGNMFSMMGASAFLPFLPMLPKQILLNNFIYDMSQISLPTDNVDAEDVKKPPRWNIKLLRKYILIFGPISSVFDFATFGILYFGFSLTEHQFQTGWFLESLATQILVIYFIRTKKTPFFRSKPSKTLLINTLLLLTIAWVIPFSPVGKFFDFVPLSVPVLASILTIVFIYLLVVETAKRFLYKKIAAKLI